MNPYVFIVGCPRSGTTLLRRLADAHPRLAVMPEQHWLPRFWEARAGLTADGMVKPDMLDWLLSDRRFELLELPVKDVAALIDGSRRLSFAQFVTRIFDLYGAVRGKPHVGEKTPKYVASIDTLAGLWPQARVVHLIRDGRDVALSLLEWDKQERNVGRLPGWTADPVGTAASYWQANVRRGRESGSRLGRDRYREFRYEALVSDPERELAALCSFLELDYEPGMLDFHVGRVRPAKGRSAKEAWQPITSGLRDWQTDMPGPDIARFDAVAGDLLDELGYSRGAIGRPAA